MSQTSIVQESGLPSSRQDQLGLPIAQRPYAAENPLALFEISVLWSLIQVLSHVSVFIDCHALGESAMVFGSSVVGPKYLPTGPQRRRRRWSVETSFGAGRAEAKVQMRLARRM